MIQEGNLKARKEIYSNTKAELTNFLLQKGFIIATLISTILGTFTTSMNLHDKYQEKQQRAKQKKLDKGQDKQIKELHSRINRLRKVNGKSEALGHRSRPRPKPESSRSPDSGDREDEDFNRSAKQSRALIERAFDAHVRRLGPLYAQGDVVAENRLQAHIIQMQQVVINTLQDALLNHREVSRADLHRLVVAQEDACQGSLAALRRQYKRTIPNQLQHSEIEHATRRLCLLSPLKHQLIHPVPDERIKNFSANIRNARNSRFVYCRYAADLQRDQTRSLYSSYSTSSTQKCLVCSVALPVTTQDMWLINTRTPIQAFKEEDLVEVRCFSMGARLIVKSHTTLGELMCVLCYNERDAFCLCATVDALVQHMGRVHTSQEFIRESDMVLEPYKHRDRSLVDRP